MHTHADDYNTTAPFKSDIYNTQLPVAYLSNWKLLTPLLRLKFKDTSSVSQRSNSNRKDIMTALRKVIIVGAGGTNIGHHVARTLAADPSFELSILSRASSKSTYPSNATIITVPDKAGHEDYVKALQGQDTVVSALGFEGLPTEKAIIDAAIEAGVKRFMPSEYGMDNTNPASQNLSPVFKLKAGIIEYLKSKESTGLTWTAVPTGMWLDWYVLFLLSLIPQLGEKR
jgi:hypothetical protein